MGLAYKAELKSHWSYKQVFMAERIRIRALSGYQVIEKVDGGRY